MLHKAKVAVCSDIHTKHSKQRECHVEFLNIKPVTTERNRYAFKGPTQRGGRVNARI